MGDSHPRTMEGGWNHTGDVWPVPVECLLSGMNTDAHLMFGGSHVFPPPQFRHRFQPPVHLAPLDGSINVSIPSIAQHTLVEAQVDDSGNPAVSDNNGQDAHISQPLSSLDNGVLDESTDDDDDDEDEEGDDDEDDDDDMGQHEHQQQQHSQQQQQHPGGGPLTMGHILENDTLVQCSQQVQNSLLEQQQQQQAAMMPMDTFQVQQQCLQQKQSHVIQHDHSQPLNSLTMSMAGDDFISQNNDTNVVENDPNSGLSVHGKMYLEGRVVFHLKQWTDGISGNNGHIFSSCAEQQHQKGHLPGCVVCRLSSPENYRNPKEAAHRHTVKGVLFTFEDCIIVELYPESSPNTNTDTPKPPPRAPPQSEPQPKDHPMPITSYMTSAIPLQSEEEQQEHAKKFMQQHHLDVSNCLANQVTVQSHQNSSEKHADQSETTDWWDGFESSEELKRGEAEEQHLDTSNSNPTTDSSCTGNLKLHNTNNQQQQQETTRGGVDEEEEEEDVDDDDDDGDCDEQNFKIKCPNCSDSFSNSNNLESHSCRSHSFVTQLEDVELSSSGGGSNNSVHNDNNNHDTVAVLQLNEESEQCRATTESCMQSDKIILQDTTIVGSRRKYRHPCPKCDKGFHLKKLLKQHLEEIHIDSYPFRCGRCDQQFTEETRLKKHACHITTKVIDKEDDHQVSSSLNCFGKICAKTLPVSTELVSISNNGSVDDDKISSDDDEDDDDDEEEDNDVIDRTVINVKSEPRVLRRKSTRRKITINPREESSSGQENHDVDFENSRDAEDDDQLVKCSDSITTVNKNKKKIKSEKQFKCEICLKSFTVERRLQNHKLSHTKERLSQCEKCGKRFARKDKLMRHMYVHSEEKLFSCDICQKRFSRRDKLSDHLKSHGSMDEIHNCPMCQKQFLRPDILKQHVKLHTMGNKHQCIECLRFVTGKDRLEKHMARHKEAKALGQTLLCPLCTKYFIQKQSLKAHVKKFHPDANINLDTPDSEFSQQNEQDSSEMPTTTVSLKPSRLISGDGEQCNNNNNNKPFVCTQCHKPFARKQALKKHLRKHQSSELSSSSKSSDEPFNPSPRTSPDEQDNSSLPLSLPSTNSASPVQHALSSNNITTQSPAHVILIPTSQHPPTPPINVTNSPGCHSPQLNESPPHIPPILQHNLTSVQCTQLHPLSHHHNQSHHLLTHGGGHTTTQIPSMSHSTTGQLHANLGSLSHMTVPAMHHHMATTQQQSMCDGPSYVLAYQHYSYQ